MKWTTSFVATTRAIRTETARRNSAVSTRKPVNQEPRDRTGAHGKRLYHRGLAPQNILVRDRKDDTPRLQITNWQVASRGEGSSVSGAMTAGTLHVEDHLVDPAKVYLAPEATAGADEGAARADVFSLGAIAYHILTGRPPATSPLDLPGRLREGNGLLLSGAMNGAGRWLEELVRVSTAPIVRDRPRAHGETSGRQP